MDRIKKKILIIFLVIILIMLSIYYVFEKINDQKESSKDFIQSEIAYVKISDFQDGIMFAVKNKNKLIVDVNDNVIEKIDKDANDINILYDGYYTYKIEDKIYLNRDGKNIKTIDEEEQSKFTLYKDENDKNSRYVAINANFIKEDIYYVTLNNEEETKTIIYNAKTGKKLYETKNSITLLKESDSEEYNYFIVDNKELISLKNFKRVFKKSNVQIISDSLEEKENDYLIISNNDLENIKCGLINYEGNIVIPLSYEEIKVNSINKEYIVAKKDKKYGLINSNNEILLNFEYDSIEIYKNYIVLISNQKFEIMDKNLERIYNFEKEIEDIENFLEIIEANNNLIVNITSKESAKAFLINSEHKIEEYEESNLKYIFDENNIIKNTWFVEEKLDDKTLMLNIFDEQGVKASSYETLTHEEIKEVNYELISEECLLVSLVNNEDKYIYQAILNLTSGKVLAENNETASYIKKQALKDNYVYEGKDNIITIIDKNDEY